MPYNTTAIPPQEPDGTSSLPQSRIKKIIKLDDEIDQCTPAATFLITLATEMFIQHLTSQGHQMTKSERKPRKNMQYKDLANAVSRMDNLEFLSDTIPKTMTYTQALETVKRNQEKKDAAAQAQKDAGSGADEIISPSRRPNGHADVIIGKGAMSEDEDEEDEEEESGKGRKMNGNGTQHHNVGDDTQSEEDVEMAT